MTDPTFTNMRMVAIQLHEAFTELVAAGFTPDQAIQLVIGMVNRGD